jgi:hypothetical protein
MLTKQEYIKIVFAKSDEVIVSGPQYPYIEICLRKAEIDVFLYESSTGHGYIDVTSALQTVQSKYPHLRIKGIETTLFTKLT